MINKEYLDRYQKALTKITPGELLSLPEGVKRILINSTELSEKVIILEQIAKGVERSK